MQHVWGIGIWTSLRTFVNVEHANRTDFPSELPAGSVPQILVMVTLAPLPLIFS